MLLHLLLAAQVVALGVLIGRLLPGRTRRPPVEPLVPDEGPPSVSVLLPVRNEAGRVRPCLEGLTRQGPTVREIVVIDGGSTDDTLRVVDAVTARDRRVRVLEEPPLPHGWIGKVWALQQGLEHTSAPWVLTMDADTEPVAGLAAAAVRVAEELKLDAVSFSPCFAGQTAAEQWVQPALLLSLVYRSGAAPASGVVPAHRTLANGQCFLARRAVLAAHGGFAAARHSFSDDVTVARQLARLGARVGFLDGSRLYRVRAYASLGEMWREWGRSIALTDATPPAQLAAELLYLALVQGAPLFALAWAAPLAARGPAGWLLIGVNAVLAAIRLAMLAALARAYERRRFTYWLSPLADPLAVVRLLVSTLRRPRQWRGRLYTRSQEAGGDAVGSA